MAAAGAAAGIATTGAGAAPEPIQAEGAAPGALAEGLPDPGSQMMAPTGAVAGQGSASIEGAGAAAGGERSGERRGRRRGRRGRRGGGPRDGAAGGPAAFTPNDAEGAPEDYAGDDAESNDPAEGAAQAANGHAGNGADFPMGEPPRSEPRGGASISWTGMAVAEATPAIVAVEPAIEREPVIETVAGDETLEPSAIDTAKLPKLETPTEDAPVPPPRWSEEPQVAAAVPHEPPAAVAVHAAPAEAAAAPRPDPVEAAPPAPSIDAVPAAPPSRVVWTSGPAPQVPDRGRED